MKQDSKILNVNDIKKLLPHRYPMLLVDQITSYTANESIVGLKNVTINEWFFEGHFPDKPIMPGVLIVEALAQTAGCLMRLSLEESAQEMLMYFMRIENAVFKKPVEPGHSVELHVEVVQQRSNVAKFKGQAKVAGELCCEASFMAMMAPNQE